MTALTFKIASEDWEFEQIHRLNYQTFVEEIPQHPESPQKLLVDKFHAENTYVIALEDKLLVGMIAVRDRRPFSLSGKLDNLEAYLPPHRALVEVRLLAVAKNHRSPRVAHGLLYKVGQYGEAHGYDLAIISGTVRQTKLYRRLGFVPFGPLVGAPGAQFQPMYLTLVAYRSVKAHTVAYNQAVHNGAASRPSHSSDSA